MCGCVGVWVCGCGCTWGVSMVRVDQVIILVSKWIEQCCTALLNNVFLCVCVCVCACVRVCMCM